MNRSKNKFPAYRFSIFLSWKINPCKNKGLLLILLPAWEKSLFIPPNLCIQFIRSQQFQGRSVMEYLPATSVVVPPAAPLTATETPCKDFPFSSDTVPEIVWAWTAVKNEKNNTDSACFMKQDLLLRFAFTFIIASCLFNNSNLKNEFSTKSRI